jgi:hypothetical protein
MPAGDDASDIPHVAFSTEAFDEALATLQQRYDAGAGARIAFSGGSRADHQQALATLSEHTIGRVHQFEMPALIGERRMQTQNSLRKAFDAAAEEGALLFFDQVDMLFDWRHPDTLGGDEEPTSIEYFLQRVEAFGGVVALGLQSSEHVDAAREYDLQLVVTFD